MNRLFLMALFLTGKKKKTPHTLFRMNMHKLIFPFLALLILIIVPSSTSAIVAVSNCSALQNMSDDLTESYYLTGNVNCSGFDYGDGKGFKPVGNNTDCFNGTLDGKGYSIYDLNISRVGTSKTGLFGVTGSGALVKNMTLEDAIVHGGQGTGIVAGYNNGTINYVKATGDAQGNGDNDVGGLVGWNINGIINNSKCECHAYGKWGSGGLVGWNGDDGTVENSYTKHYYYTGTKIPAYAYDVTGTSYIGGLVGYNDGTVKNSYSHSSTGVPASSYKGGLVGYNAVTGTIDKSYAVGGNGLAGYNSGSCNGFYSAGSSTCGTSKTAAQMKTKSTFTDAGWDFCNGGAGVWAITESYTYPCHDWKFDDCSCFASENITSCQLLLEPGTYFLSANIASSPEEKCMNVQTSYVTVDCQNDTNFIESDGADTHYGVYVYSSYATIKNCVIRNWTNGIYFYSNGGIAKDSNLSYNAQGVYFRSDYNNVSDCNISHNTNGLYYWAGAAYNLVNDSRIESNGNGVYFYEDSGIVNNEFYNNIFNNSDNVDWGVDVSQAGTQIWNTTQVAVTNIIGGSNIGGNYWGDNAGTGFSDTCPNVDGDDFCDTWYGTGKGSDYLAYATGTRNVTDCLTINVPGTYYLDNDIDTTTGSCIYISASDVIMDCKWHLVNVSIGYVGAYVVYIGGNNVTLRNCQLQLYDEIDIGLWTSGDNGRIENIIVTEAPIYLSYAHNNVIQNVTCIGDGTPGRDCLFLYYSNNNNVTDLTNRITDSLDDINCFTGENNTYRNINQTHVQPHSVHMCPGDKLYNSTISRVAFSAGDFRGVIIENNTITTQVWANPGSDLGNITFRGNNISYGGIGYMIDCTSVSSLSPSVVFYDNIMNGTTIDPYCSGLSLNTTKTAGTNIIGKSYIGGNYYVNSTATAYGQVCWDFDGDYICGPHEVASGFYDYLPLTATLENVTIHLPENTTYGNVTQDFNWSALQSSQINYSVNDGAVSTTSVNTTITGQGGSNKLNVTANDSVGNTGDFLRYFTIDLSPPYWSGNQTSLPAVYDVSGKLYFNVSWDDALSSVNTTLIETNISGSAANYTMTNITATIFNYTFDCPGAGDYYWKSYANDTFGHINSSDAWTFTIPKAQSRVDEQFNGTQNSDRSYTEGTSWNITAYSNVSILNVTLYIDSVLVNYSLGYAQNLSAVGAVGNYNITAYALENANYTGSSREHTITVVSAGTPTYSNIIDDSPTDWTPSAASHMFNVTWTWNSTLANLSSVLLDFNGTNYTMTANRSIDADNAEFYIQLSFSKTAGTYSYTMYANNTVGNMGTTPAQSYTISKITPITNMLLSIDGDSWSVTYPTAITVTGTETNSGDGDSTYLLYMNEILQSNPFGPATLTEETYTFKLSTDGGENYTSGYITRVLTVGPVAAADDVGGGGPILEVIVLHLPSVIEMNLTPGSCEIIMINATLLDATEPKEFTFSFPEKAIQFIKRPENNKKIQLELGVNEIELEICMPTLVYQMVEIPSGFLIYLDWKYNDYIFKIPVQLTWTEEPRKVPPVGNYLLIIAGSLFAATIIMIVIKKKGPALWKYLGRK